jgi:hypothetical protein
LQPEIWQYDRSAVRRIAVLKCWETNFSFNPEAFLDNIQSGLYDWADLRRLIRRGYAIKAETIIRDVQNGFKFLKDLAGEESILANDPYKRQKSVYKMLAANIFD